MFPNRFTTALVIISLVLSTAVVPATGSPTETSQNNPESPEEYLATFESLDGTAALDAYSEFEVVRSQAIQDVQIGEFTDETAQRMARILELLERFDETYQAEQDSSYENALDLANETREINKKLRTVEGGEQYALLSDIALDRFYGQVAQELLNQAEGIERTPDRVDVLSQAATAYNEAGEVDQFADVQLRVDQTQQRFETDSEQLNASTEILDEFVTSCTDCGSVEEVIMSDTLSVFSLYGDSQAALAAGAEASELADRHGLDSVETELEGTHQTAEEYQRTLIFASAAIVMTYSAVLALVVALVTWRLMLWKRDFVASQRGDVVLMGEMLNA